MAAMVGAKRQTSRRTHTHTHTHDRVQGGGQGKDVNYGVITNAPDLRVRQLKQEAGEVESVDGGPIDFEQHPIGSILLL